VLERSWSVNRGQYACSRKRTRKDWIPLAQHGVHVPKYPALTSLGGRPEQAYRPDCRQGWKIETDPLPVFESGTPPVSTYTFKHALIQDAAYESLLRKTRQEFHNKIAVALIQRFPELAETKPELLARHYEGAGRIAESTAGWMKAGLQAQQRFALRECVAYLQKTIALLETLPDDDAQRLRSEMEAQLALSHALTATFGWASRELEAACIRARDLCKRLENGPGLMQALLTLSGMYFLRGNHRESVQVADAVLDVTLPTNNPLLEIEARHAISFPTYFLGDFVGTREHAEKGLALYTPERERAVVATFHVPSSFACAHILSLSLWFLGYPDQARKTHRDAWVIADTLNINACTAYALGCTLDYHYLFRDHAAIAPIAERAHKLSIEEGYLFWVAQTRIFLGWVQAMTGMPQAGIQEMKAGLESYRATGSGLLAPEFCMMMGEAQLQAGRVEEALESFAGGLRHSAENGERLHEAELHRLTGEIHLMRGDGAAGEAGLRAAIEIAQAQKARMPELRASLALARIRRREGRTQDLRALLEPLDAWFQGGRDTAELRELRALLTPKMTGATPD